MTRVTFGSGRRAVACAATILCATLVLAGVALATAANASPSGTWAWPVIGPVVRGFDPPSSAYGSGHRGIDIAAPLATTIVAPAAGTVRFAGKVGGYLFVSIDHGRGLESTYSWLSAVQVHRGDSVFEGAPIAKTGEGHPGSTVPHLHFGVKSTGTYVDPLSFLRPPSVADFIHLAPLRGMPPAP